MQKTFHLLISGLCVLFFSQTGISQMQSPMPQGEFQVSIKPASMGNSPISVSSVSTDVTRGLAVSKVKLSLSDPAKRKPITKIKISWIVIDESRNAKIIGSGESGLIFLTQAQGQPIRLNSTVFSFASFVESLGTNVINGKFRVDLLVSFTEFANGENWKFDLPKVNSVSSQYIKITRKAKKTVACPGQSCRWNNIINSYQCDTDFGFSCTNAANGLSCTSAKCGSGGEFELEM